MPEAISLGSSREVVALQSTAQAWRFGCCWF